ncbi:uncharacterized protein LOC107621006 [Arachis ipaensis]|uniref:uncharacterized protein LOC107621006 n=1 Tax=Arachis ipaensis TaxID=130454 RepID=UPI0007AF1D03|nr:uncharacterized protein LOC107621006 [Arachis ipaensis]
MSSSFTMIKDLDLSNEPQIWRIKVCIIKRWSISTGEDKYKKPMLEFVVMDMLGDRIQCSIKNPMRRLFENDIVEGRIVTLSNFSLAVNDQKYKPTTHSHRIYFKRETQIRPLEDSKFPDNVFHFVPNEIILGHDNPQSHLIDVIGLLTGKGDTIEFTKNGKKSIYIILELDDIQGKGKIRCTLWEEFANQLVQHMQNHPTTEYILIVQFAKQEPYMATRGRGRTHTRESRNEPPADNHAEFMAAMANLANTMEANATATLQAVQRLGQPAKNGNGEGNANDNAKGNGDNMGVVPMTLATFLKAQQVPLNQYVEFAAYQLAGEAQPWWQAECRLLQLQNADIPWEVFQTTFYKKYFPESARKAKKMELMQLKQGSMSVAEYTNKFEELCRFSRVCQGDPETYKS